MAHTLFCQLSRSFMTNEAQINELFQKALPKFKFQDILLTSPNTAIVWILDDAAAVSLVKKGKNKKTMTQN